MNRHFFSNVSLKNTARLCLFLQCFSVFWLSFAPVISVVGKEGNLFRMSSTPYVLRAGETTASVAGRFGLTLQQLKTFNQFRVFHKPFAQLTEGDEIDVPARTAIKNDDSTAENQQSASSARPEEPHQSVFSVENSTFGRTAESAQSAGAAVGMARSMASGAANEAVSKWLGQFGTVRAGLSLNAHNSLANSSIDWLAPGIRALRFAGPNAPLLRSVQLIYSGQCLDSLQICFENEQAYPLSL